jgi:hypothetical protein
MAEIHHPERVNATPEQIVALATAIGSGNIRVCYNRCHSCMAGFHFNPPAEHRWADLEDIQHAKAAGYPEPTGLCGCPCAHGEPVPNIDAGMVENDQFDVDETGMVLGDPCPECGEVGVCAYDQEGRPMIHTTSPEARDD